MRLVANGAQGSCAAPIADLLTSSGLAPERNPRLGQEASGGTRMKCQLILYPRSYVCSGTKRQGNIGLGHRFNVGMSGTNCRRMRRHYHHDI
jgi:hypothetical protein